MQLRQEIEGAIGRAGFDGYVDDHWLERFGSALLLSIVSDASQFAGQRLQQGSNVQANGSTQAGKQGAAIAVEQSIDIPPKLIKHQGELVNSGTANTVYSRAAWGQLRSGRPLVAGSC